MLYILNFAHKLNQFSHASMLAAKALGIDFHIISNWAYPSIEEREADAHKHGITIHQVDFMRNPLHPGNIKAYRQVSSIMKQEQFDLVHTNTPIGGILGRLAACKHGVKHVIYQAHGFHFYQGSSRASWLLYYSIEKMMASLTDLLITINQEDFLLATNKLHLRRKGDVILVPGIGIDYDAYARISVDRKTIKQKIGIPDDAPMIFSVGELNQNKNHEIIILALENVPDAHYAIAGEGKLKDQLIALADKHSLSDRIHLLGYRSDVKQLYKAADVFCLPSFREGLSASVMEAMASGLPVVCSDIRGNRDLIVNDLGGYLVGGNDVEGYSNALHGLIQSIQLRKDMGDYNSNYVRNFSLEKVTQKMKSIYSNMLQMEDKEVKDDKQNLDFTKK